MKAYTVPQGLPEKRHPTEVRHDVDHSAWRHASQISNIYLNSKPGMAVGRLRRPLACMDAGERTSALVNEGVLGLGLVSQAHQLCLSAGDGAQAEGVRGRTLGVHGGARWGVLEVEPVVAVLQAEDVSLDVFVVVSGCRAESRRVEVEVDQSALDVEEAVRLGFLLAYILPHRGFCAIWGLDWLVGVWQVEAVAASADRVVVRRRPHVWIRWPGEDVDAIEIRAAGEG
jgi:hypothetical protein